MSRNDFGIEKWLLVIVCILVIGYLVIATVLYLGYCFLGIKAVVSYLLVILLAYPAVSTKNDKSSMWE